MRRSTVIRTAVGATLVCAPVLLAPAGQAQVPDGQIVLPAPVQRLPTFSGLGLRPDRRLVSHVPGPVRTRERVTVVLAGNGAPSTVSLDERLSVTGTGDYLIYERGPARAVIPLDDSPPPVLKRGTVVWQGFSPAEGRELAARLRLDPVLETERLPLAVALTWHPPRGHAARPLGPGGAVPGAGTVTVRLTNKSGVPRAVPTGTARASDLADSLTRLLSAATDAAEDPKTAHPLPATSRGLPARITASQVGSVTALAVAPLRVTGTIRARGTRARLSGPAVHPLRDGGQINGVLSSTAEFTLQVHKGSRVSVELLAVPTLDPRTLRPPGRAKAWTGWAATQPGAQERRTATGQLVSAAAATARIAELSPYVGAETPGVATTTFRFTTTPQAVIRAEDDKPLTSRPYALALVIIAAALLLGIGTVLWRRL